MEKLSNNVSSEEFKHSFDYLWTVAILPTIKNAREEIDEDFSKACGLELAKDIDDYKINLMSFYHEKRQWLKGVYLPHDNHPLLDIHKVGALICRSLLAYKPFYFDTKKAEKYVTQKFRGDKNNHVEWFVKNIYVNYRVAFYVSTSLVYIELLNDYCPNGEKSNKAIFEHFKHLGGVEYYPKSENHDSFENSCILALQKNDGLKRDFDCLTYATMLFQLEHYNRSRIPQFLAVPNETTD